MIQLLQLDLDTWINPQKIVKITIVDLNRVRRDRNQHVETPEQRERLNGYWEVSVYLRSEGYNPARFTKRFRCRNDAQNWIMAKFGSVIIDKL